MRRTVVFIGNCQIEAVLQAYRRFTADGTRDRLYYVRSYEAPGEPDRLAIETADVIVEQVQEFKPTADLSGFAVRGRRIGVPVAHGGFLWPFAGQPHPRNPAARFVEGGVYGNEMSDAFLNRMIHQNIDVEAAESAYLALDVNQTVKLDRLYELSLEKQRQRDAATGFQIAPLIEEHFRTEPQFFTPYHPRLRIALALIEQTFRKLEVAAADLELLRWALRESPFPKEELPVHPAVARHFNLQWATEDRRYRFLQEGSFTFREFVRRYLTCDWNADLWDGMGLAAMNQWLEARAALTAGLRKSPFSAVGLATLSNVYVQLRDDAKALSAVRSSIELDSESAMSRLQLALLEERAGHRIDAERQYRMAAALEPFDPHYPGMLLQFLLTQGRYAEARALAVHGLVCAPRAANLHAALGFIHEKLGDVAAAKAAYTDAIECADPPPESALFGLAELHQREGDDAAAVPLLRRVVERNADHRIARGRLAMSLGRTGAAADAERLWQSLAALEPATREAHVELIQVFLHGAQHGRAVDAARRALGAFPGDVEFTAELAGGLADMGRLDEAFDLVKDNPAPESVNPRAVLLVADLLHRRGDFAAAEAAYRRALELTPVSAHAYGQLGSVLIRQARYDEAITALEAACAAEPTNPHRRVQLGHACAGAGRLDAAETAIRTGIAELPNAAHFHADLAYVLDASGRIEEAIECIRRALELDPSVHRGDATLADLYAKLALISRTETERSLSTQ